MLHLVHLVSRRTGARPAAVAVPLLALSALAVLGGVLLLALR